jgi:predicted transcriptional regulator of viral defense system
MTYKKLQTTAKALLSSDYPLPEDNDSILSLLDMAYQYIVDNCQVLNLNTLDKSSDIIRLGRGKYLVRKPELPTSDTDELDIDDSLGYVAASLIASYISEKKMQIHQTRADNGIRSYNAKVDELLESLADIKKDAE